MYRLPALPLVLPSAVVLARPWGVLKLPVAPPMATASPAAPVPARVVVVQNWGGVGVPLGLRVGEGVREAVGGGVALGVALEVGEGEGDTPVVGVGEGLG
jgi:hypothetical protein